MDETLPNIDDAQGFAKKSIDSLHHQLVPHIKEVKEADAMSKDPASIKQAYETVYEIYKNGQLAESLHTSFGWIIYRYIKQMLETGDTLAVKNALKTYLNLSVERPSILHSCVLREAIKLEQNHKAVFKFTNFLSMWGMDNFTEEDWEQGTKDDGTKYNSTVEQAIVKYAAELKDDKISNVPSDFVNLINKAIERYGKPLYSYYKARILANAGNTDKALSLYRKLVAKTGQAYLWNDIADIVGDPASKKAAVCKYILSQTDKRYLGGAHLKLAEILIREKKFAEALCELNAYNEIRTTYNFQQKSDYFYLCQQIPSQTEASTDNKTLYKQCAKSIDDFIFSDCPTVFLVLTNVITNKKGKLIAQLVSSNNDRVSINARQLKRNKANGYHRFYTGRIFESDGKKKVVGLSMASEQETVNGFPLHLIEDTVRVIQKTPEKKYGFVKNCYVHEKLLSGISDGDLVKVYAQENAEGKQQAVTIEKL